MKKSPVEYGLLGRIWLAFFDEAEVRSSLAAVPEDVMTSAVTQANYWVYNRRSPNWDYCKTNAVEKQMLKNDPVRYDVRRLAFMRHVLATVATRRPAVVDGILDAVGA